MTIWRPDQALDWFIDALAFTQEHPWLLCALFLLAPFVQEDGALIGAVAIAASGAPGAWGALIAVLAGLTLCASCKYALGLLSARSRPLRRLGARASVAQARQILLGRLGLSLIAARFVPGTRIPLYLACGAARAPLPKFAACVAVSGFAYLCAGALLIEVARPGVGAWSAIA